MKKPRSLKTNLLSASGKVWMYWPPRQEVKKRCAIKDKKGWWNCEICKRATERLEVDHIHPIVKPEDGFRGWDIYYEAKFVQADKLQGLCRECHHEKSKTENKVRRLCKKLKKTV